MRENVFAYTAPGAFFPEYLSVNRLGETGRIEISVRISGATSAVELRPDQARELAHAILSSVR